MRLVPALCPTLAHARVYQAHWAAGRGSLEGWGALGWSGCLSFSKKEPSRSPGRVTERSPMGRKHASISHPGGLDSWDEIQLSSSPCSLRSDCLLLELAVISSSICQLSQTQLCCLPAVWPQTSHSACHSTSLVFRFLVCIMGAQCWIVWSLRAFLLWEL